MILRLRPARAVLANAAAWALIHSLTGYLVHRLPPERLRRDGPVLRLRRWEDGGRWYERLRIRRWKDRVPEAGALFTGGTSKRTVGDDLERFVVETRRAERGHWLAMACGPVALLWNPPVGSFVMVAYGVAANAPCIAIQRYNRARALRVLAARSRTSRSTSPGRAVLRTSGSSIP